MRLVLTFIWDDIKPCLLNKHAFYCRLCFYFVLCFPTIAYFLFPSITGNMQTEQLTYTQGYIYEVQSIKQHRYDDYYTLRFVIDGNEFYLPGYAVAQSVRSLESELAAYENEDILFKVQFTKHEAILDDLWLLVSLEGNGKTFVDADYALKQYKIHADEETDFFKWFNLAAIPLPFLWGILQIQTKSGKMYLRDDALVE